MSVLSEPAPPRAFTESLHDHSSSCIVAFSFHAGDDSDSSSLRACGMRCLIGDNLGKGITGSCEALALGRHQMIGNASLKTIDQLAKTLKAAFDVVKNLRPTTFNIE
eukprot:1156351-Pelagomonas_calceolata.AAC.14